MATPFKKVYEAFLDKITDDMYIELTPLDTQKDMQAILLSSIPKFEFPKKSLTYDKQVPNTETGEDTSSFIEDLDIEEINILANLMLINWLQRQITSIENTRQKYYGGSFKLTSQANHLKTLLTLKEDILKDDKHLQRLYSRRKVDSNGKIVSAWSDFNTYN